MLRVLPRFEPQAYALLRIITGLMFLLHGTQKLFAWPATGRPPLSVTSFYGFGGLLEIILGAMIALGLFTGIAAFLASGEMAVAYFLKHAPEGFLPIVNKGELAVVYCWLFLYVATRGGGIWSIDSLRKKRG